MTGVLLGIPAGGWPGADPTALVELARRAEDAGFAGVVISDHIVMGSRTDRYPWGSFPVPDGTDWPEPLTVLTLLAGATTQLRLCTGILIAPLRPAILLAKTAATLDVLSGGRLELGVATGWQREEFEAESLDFAARGQMLTDTIAACRALWAPGSASLSSTTVSFDDLYCDPKPAQEGGPPVLFAGTMTPRNIKRIVELGDGWIPIMGEPAAGVEAGLATLRNAYVEAGRDPARLAVRAELPILPNRERPELAATLSGVTTLADAGATRTVLAFGAFRQDASTAAVWFEEAALRLAELP